MSQHIGGDRYVLYLLPGKDTLESIDNSLAGTIEGEIEKFLTAWNPADVFAKSVTKNVGQIKKDRSVVRAFGTWWDGGDVHILLVLAVYKKTDERAFWDDCGKYDRIAREYIGELDTRHANSELEQSLENLAGNEDYRLIRKCFYLPSVLVVGVVFEVAGVDRRQAYLREKSLCRKIGMRMGGPHPQMIGSRCLFRTERIKRCR